MSKYLVLFKADGAGADQAAGPTAQEHQAWLAWKADAGDAIVDFGAPLVAAGDNAVIGYSIVQADSVAALDSIFETNPHRRRGGTLEFHQIVEMADD